MSSRRRGPDIFVDDETTFIVEAAAYPREDGETLTIQTTQPTHEDATEYVRDILSQIYYRVDVQSVKRFDEADDGWKARNS